MHFAHLRTQNIEYLVQKYVIWNAPAFYKLWNNFIAVKVALKTSDMYPI